ncbi:MAG: ribonuclease R, partial [Betaproteobacteria bacterium]
DDMYVEGLVHITELGGEYFRFDEARQELRGERTGMRYAIGSRVRVQVSRVDLDGRRIDFRLVHEGEELLLRSAKERGGARESAPRGEVEATGAKRSQKKASPVGARALKPALAARMSAGKPTGKKDAPAKVGRKPRR